MRFKNYTLTILVALFIFTSCDVLDQTPQQSLPTAEIFTTEANVRAVLAGAYNGLQGAVPYNIRFAELAGDNAGHTGSYPSWASVDQHNLLASNAEARDLYINYYEVINTANNLIKFTDQVDEVSFLDAEKENIIAQAKVIRALSYHTLVSWFGGVPLVIEPVDGIDESANAPRASVSDIYQQIITDLKEAETTLGSTGTSGSSTVNGFTAKALLARVYLYNKQYDLAEAKATDVIDNGNYDVTGVDYISNFGAAESDGQGSNESIFELLFTTEDSNNLSFFARPNGNGGRFEYGPELAYLNLYEAGDTRYDANIRVYSGDNVLGKYFRVNGSDNIIIVRLAEMYLIRAEAIAQQDYSSPARALVAQDDINIIRNRAGLADIDPLTVTSLQDFMDELMLQRRIELDQEGHRWHDLVRTGRAVPELGISQNATLWPIPQREIDTNSGIKPEDQNPGY